jgi:Uma2 family endonuclease
MVSVQSQSTLAVAEDLYQLPDSARVEIIRGELIEMSPANFDHAWISQRISRALGNFAEPEFGAVLAPSGGFILSRNPDTLVEPDASFVRIDRIPTSVQRQRFVELAPDLAVEVLSPSERMTAVAKKVELYLAAGVQLVWVVDPQRKIVRVYTPGRTARILRAANDDALDGGDVLPGFSLRLADVFV